MKNIAFDSEQYLNLQRDHILERISQFDGKLYMEFGGKMLEDFMLPASCQAMNRIIKSSFCMNCGTR